MSITNSSQIQQQKNLSLSDLESSESNQKSQTMSIYEFRSNQLEFAANVASTNRDIEAARDDLQVLMTKAHAYCKNTGVASGSPLLASTPPRRRTNNNKFTPSSRKQSKSRTFSSSTKGFI
ncbi:hypothetical protein M9Y10_004935 [Tritrichomonas musculus]|uniref:Uncharacterized protein n=1 Tax=Tritrichomonas musculus TaxID=1915356 RepID=A0ABR2JMB5_9EUKA